MLEPIIISLIATAFVILVGHAAASRKENDDERSLHFNVSIVVVSALGVVVIGSLLAVQERLTAAVVIGVLALLALAKSIESIQESRKQGSGKK